MLKQWRWWVLAALIGMGGLPQATIPSTFAQDAADLELEDDEELWVPDEEEVDISDLQELQPGDLDGEALEASDDNATPLSKQVEDLKQAALELNRDLLLLEEDLLFPASTQVAVYVSIDVGHYFQLDAVKLKIDDEMVASHTYSAKQNSALKRGGIQRLYVGNLKTGRHEITAFFHGYGPQEREYKRGATYSLKKEQKPTMLEIRIMDSTSSMQPEFDFKEWEL